MDVDEIDNLDTLFFAVKLTRKLMIMLSPDVMRRHWCAVEIGAAFINKIPMTVVQINDLDVEITVAYIEASSLTSHRTT